MYIPEPGDPEAGGRSGGTHLSELVLPARRDEDPCPEPGVVVGELFSDAGRGSRHEHRLAAQRTCDTTRQKWSEQWLEMWGG